MMRRGGGGWLVRVGIYIFDVDDVMMMMRQGMGGLSLMLAYILCNS